MQINAKAYKLLVTIAMLDHDIHILQQIDMQ